MNDYTQSVVALLLALLVQFFAAGMATDVFLRRELNTQARHSWLALAIASLIFALHHGYALELALRTGLYDWRQSLLAAVAALLIAYAVSQFRRQA